MIPLISASRSFASPSRSGSTHGEPSRSSAATTAKYTERWRRWREANNGGTASTWPDSPSSFAPSTTTCGIALDSLRSDGSSPGLTRSSGNGDVSSRAACGVVLSWALSLASTSGRRLFSLSSGHSSSMLLGPEVGPDEHRERTNASSPTTTRRRSSHSTLSPSQGHNRNGPPRWPTVNVPWPGNLHDAARSESSRRPCGTGPRPRYYGFSRFITPRDSPLPFLLVNIFGRGLPAGARQYL
jgi:hypothetical protein